MPGNDFPHNMDVDAFLKLYLKERPISNALWRTAEYQEIIKVPMKKPLLDLGCGDGSFALLLFGKGIEAGIDLNVAEVGIAREMGVYKQVHAMDARKMPFKSNAFNSVFSNCVMEHVGPLDDVLEEVGRVLRPGGQFVFTVPGDHFNEMLYFNKLFRNLGLSRLADWYVEKLNKALAHLQVEGPAFWSGRLKKAGLTLVKSNYFMSERAMKCFDITTPLGAPSRIWRKLFNRWCVMPRFWWTWAMQGYLADLLREPTSIGGGLILIAQKTGKKPNVTKKKK